MKFKGWIISGLFSVALFSATALSAVSGGEDREINEAIKQLKKTPAASNSAWPEIEKFQENMWRAMALDPGPFTIVPVKQVPKELFAEVLTTDLNQQLEAIKNSEVPKNVKAQAEFDQYLKTVRSILAFRISRQFPQARAVAKRGTLDDHYNKLMKKIGGTSVTSDHTAQEEAVRKIENYLSAMKDSKPSSQESSKKSPFTNGNQFIWAALIALIGFIFGITAIRMSPEFFEKFISSASPDQFSDSTASAATHTNQLNYARWLSEFEGLLAKLKATQLTHERRIEEVQKHSEKLSQFAAALCADPRIKNEVNLEFRMSNLLRELHLQFEQTTELKTGDRVQIQLTLEHCLKLCDAIESGGIVYQKDHPTDQPDYKQAAKVS